MSYRQGSPGHFRKRMTTHENKSNFRRGIGHLRRENLVNFNMRGGQRM